MATVTKKQCDVFGTLNNVRSFRIKVLEASEDSDGYVAMRSFDVDMSPRALARLVKFIDRGTTPPSKKKSDDHDSKTE